EEQIHFRQICGDDVIHELEIIIMVQDIELIDDGIVSDMSVRKTDDAVEYGKGIPQSSVCFFSNQMQRFRFISESFRSGDHFQMHQNVFDLTSFEIIDLTPG